jgi:hypothetical protein
MDTRKPWTDVFIGMDGVASAYLPKPSSGWLANELKSLWDSELKKKNHRLLSFSKGATLFGGEATPDGSRHHYRRREGRREGSLVERGVTGERADPAGPDLRLLAFQRPPVRRPPTEAVAPWPCSPSLRIRVVFGGTVEHGCGDEGGFRVRAVLPLP